MGTSMGATTKCTNEIINYHPSGRNSKTHGKPEWIFIDMRNFPNKYGWYRYCQSCYRWYSVNGYNWKDCWFALDDSPRTIEALLSTDEGKVEE